MYWRVHVLYYRPLNYRIHVKPYNYEIADWLSIRYYCCVYSRIYVGIHVWLWIIECRLYLLLLFRVLQYVQNFVLTYVQTNHDISFLVNYRTVFQFILLLVPDISPSLVMMWHGREYTVTFIHYVLIVSKLVNLYLYYLIMYLINFYMYSTCHWSVDLEFYIL